MGLKKTMAIDKITELRKTMSFDDINEYRDLEKRLSVLSKLPKEWNWKAWTFFKIDEESVRWPASKIKAQYVKSAFETLFKENQRDLNEPTKKLEKLRKVVNDVEKHMCKRLKHNISLKFYSLCE